MTGEQVKAYFERLGMKETDAPVADAALLKKLVYMHSLLIPFENREFLQGGFVSCDAEVQFEKVIRRREGGICHDLATLFGCLLRALGYGCEDVIVLYHNPQGFEFLHKILLVTDRDGLCWMVDVAALICFAFPLPLKMEYGLEQEMAGMTFRIDPGENGDFSVKKKTEDGWFAMYSRVIVRDAKVEDSDKVKHFTHGDDPRNGYYKKEMFAIYTPQGARFLIANKYIERIGGSRYEFECDEDLMPWAYAQFNLPYPVEKA